MTEWGSVLRISLSLTDSVSVLNTVDLNLKNTTFYLEKCLVDNRQKYLFTYSIVQASNDTTVVEMTLII